MPILSREEAWRDPPELQRIKIDMSQRDFRLRRNWFHTRNCTTFSTHLLPKYSADRPWKFLTIGVFEGASEIWLMQNILKHPESTIISIDPWAATTKLDQEFMEECMANARYNLEPWKRQSYLIRGYSQEILRQALDDGALMGIPVGSFDFIIIDGDHNADPVYEDAVLCYQMAKPGAWLLFDDVRNDIPKKHHVAEGLQRFLDEYKDKVKFSWAHRYCDCYEKV